MPYFMEVIKEDRKDKFLKALEKKVYLICRVIIF
jgi:hypothetical protein